MPGNPVDTKPPSDAGPAEVGVVGLELLGVVGKPTFKPDKAIVNAPGVVGVTAFTGLTPGIVGVVGVVTPGVSTPVTVRTVSVEGFFYRINCLPHLQDFCTKERAYCTKIPLILFRSIWRQASPE